MKLSRRFCAMLLAVLMLIPVSVISGISASAIAGAGLGSNGFRAYGADVSYHNVSSSSGNKYSYVDFAKMKADGCQFVILRIGYEGSASRTNTLDTAFVEFYNRARAAGLHIGIYFYSLATTYNGAVEDAKWVISIIEKYNMYFEYPIYYDVEDSAQTALGATAKTNLCLGWCETLEAAGYFPGVYGTSSIVDKVSDSFKSRYDLWYARVLTNGHGSQYNPNNYDYSGKCGMWQYSWYDYNYDGVYKDMLDVNVAYKDYPSIMTQYGYNNCGTPKPTVDRSGLVAVMTGAERVPHESYDATKLQAVRVAYDAATVVNNNTDATQEDVDNAKTTLLNALLDTSAKTVLSTGKSYTVTANDRTDGFKDDGTRLTDGSKGNADGGADSKYAGFSSVTEVVVDLGSVQKVDNFTTYFAAGQWGIYAPNHTIVEVYVSSDNANFTKAASTSAALVISGNNNYDDATWSTYRMTANSDKPLDARYVKFVIDNNDPENSQNIWIDEVEVGVYTAEHITGGIYINGVNTPIAAGQTKIFTPAFNNGVVTVAAANHAWTANVVAKYDSATGAYKVKSNTFGTGVDTTADISLADDEILIAAHKWEGSSADIPVGDSGDNFDKLAALKEGDFIYLSGINIGYAFINVGAYITTASSESSAPVGTLDNVPQLAGGKNFWLTHYNNNTIEGAGVIFTEAYTGAAWWLHVAFAPTGVADVYKITAISDGTDAGDGVAQAIPEGGFVYGLNYGNDYPSINADGSGTDYTSPNCNNAIADALKWKVGDELKISGLDLSGKAIPTSTAGTNWYDDAYVCTANYVMYGASAPEYDTTVYDNMLWLTHFNDLTVEGAGVVVTAEGLYNTGWNNYYAFAPVGDGTFELVEVSIGIGTGTSVMPSIPAGGFVYSINVGNDYPAIYEADPVANAWCKDLPDYTSDNCNAMVEAVGQWEVGKTYRFGNLDLEGQTIPTTTAGTNWYEAGYVCAATFEPVTTEEDTSGDISDDTSDDTSSDNSDDTSDDDWLYGDVDNDGDIDQFDYLLVKRSYFKTYTLTEDEAKRADVDRSITVDQYDYMYIKRHYFGTYEIVQKTK